MIANPIRQRFWTSADFTLKLRVSPEAPIVVGPTFKQDAIEDKLAPIQSETVFQTVLDYNLAEQEKALQGQIAFAEEIMELQEDDTLPDDLGL